MLVVKNLKKVYENFTLKDVSFELKKGYILGFIGANGAGKTTTLKSMLNITHKDGGEVTILGEDFTKNELKLKQKIGFMLGPVDYYPKSRISKIVGVYKDFFTEWDENKYRDLLKRFDIDDSKKISELSTGMKVKLGIALALSHNAKLLIFDEPTSGVDPIARDELLDIFQEIVEDGEHGILFSTHITSDLDKCADYILLICDGQIVQNDTKDNIIDSHIVVEGKTADLTDDVISRLISYKTHSFGFKGLMKKIDMRESDNFMTEKPNLEDIMIFYNKRMKK